MLSSAPKYQPIALVERPAARQVLYYLRIIRFARLARDTPAASRDLIPYRAGAAG